MSEHRPLTDTERHNWNKWAEAVWAEPLEEKKKMAQARAQEFLRYEATLRAKDVQIATLDTKLDSMKLVLAGAIERLREAECYHDGELAEWYGKARRRAEGALQEAING